MTDQHSERLSELAEGVRTAVAEYAALAKDSGVQLEALAVRADANRRQIRRTKRMIWALIVSVALDVVLSVVAYFLVVQVQSNENAVAANGRATATIAHRLDVAQTTTRQKTLCPLYTLLLASDTPAARAAAKDKTVFDHTVKVIQDGYNALGCATTFAP